jgi:hypothetical protein
MESSPVILLYYLTLLHNCDKIIRELVYVVTRIGSIAVFLVLKLVFVSYFYDSSDCRWGLDR